MTRNIDQNVVWRLTRKSIVFLTIILIERYMKCVCDSGHTVFGVFVLQLSPMQTQNMQKQRVNKTLNVMMRCNNNDNE